MNDNLTGAVLTLASLANFVCFVLVLIQMFQRGTSGLGITCIVLAVCCGLGGLVAFIYGWLKAREWNINTLMTVWTVALAILIVAGTANPVIIRRGRAFINVQTEPLERQTFPGANARVG